MNAVLASPTPRTERLTSIPTNKHETACVGHPQFYQHTVSPSEPKGHFLVVSATGPPSDIPDISGEHYM